MVDWDKELYLEMSELIFEGDFIILKWHRMLFTVPLMNSILKSQTSTKAIGEVSSISWVIIFLIIQDQEDTSFLTERISIGAHDN